MENFGITFARRGNKQELCVQAEDNHLRLVNLLIAHGYNNFKEGSYQNFRIENVMKRRLWRKVEKLVHLILNRMQV